MDELNKVMNEVNWLVSLLVAIPLSIAGNLLTPRFQNWRSSKSRRTAERRLATVEKELRQVEKLSSNPSHLNTYLLVSLLSVLVLFSFSNVVSSFFSVLFVAPTDSHLLARLFGAMSGMANALFNLMAIIRASQALTVYQRVRDYPTYSIKTQQVVETLRQASQT